jgi:hypothetical protein
VALLANGVYLGTSGGPCRRFGQASILVVAPSSWSNAGSLRDWYAGEGTIVAGASIGNKNSLPSGGYTMPATWAMAQKPGGMASRQYIVGSSSVALPLAGGLNGVAPLTGSGTISNASLGLILSAVAAITGAGAVTASIAGKLEAAAALVGSGDLTGALGALAGLSSDPMGVGTAAGTLNGYATMSADITVTGATLTTANVASFVWGALAEGTLTYTEVQRLLLAVAAGRTTIVDNGGGTATVTFLDQAGTTDRIVADMTNSERTTIVVDGS